MRQGYTDADCESLRAQLLSNPKRVRCPIHNATVQIKETLSWRRIGDITEDHKESGWPAQQWHVRRAVIRCDACGWDESVRLEMPTRAPRPKATSDTLSVA